MKCEECQILIEDYVDGALGRKAGALVTAHIATCSVCAAFREELNREQAVYARYERDVEVTPMLWASIEARIKQERVPQPAGWTSRLRERMQGVFAAPRLSPAYAAGLVIVAIGITIGVMTYLNSRGSGPSDTVVQTAGKGGGGSDAPPATPKTGSEPGAIAKGGAEQVPAVTKAVRNPAVQKQLAANAQPNPAQLVREAEQKYVAAIAMLSRDVNRHRSQLDPMLLARFDAALGDIDRTIKETRRVVRENPGDPIALQYLLAAYSKKVDVLRGMTTD